MSSAVPRLHAAKNASHSALMSTFGGSARRPNGPPAPNTPPPPAGPEAADELPPAAPPNRGDGCEPPDATEPVGLGRDAAEACAAADANEPSDEPLPRRCGF